jgi:hypothetical protein
MVTAQQADAESYTVFYRREIRFTGFAFSFALFLYKSENA